MNYCDVKKFTIEEMHKLAKKRGGKCLSDNYVNARTKLQWECAEGHKWRSTPDNIKSGKWCPTCGINKRADALKLTIEEMHQIAKDRGGKCLSDTYENARTKLQWECAKGHKFSAKPYHVKSGSWCKICSFKKMGEAQRLNIEEMHQIAIERGGKCLSDTYENAHKKLQWECAEGHQWEAKPMNIKSGTWCPDCGGSKILTIEEMHQIAKERGGKCLSSAYINSKTKLQWECVEGHQWEARPDKIKQGRWCPYCVGKYQTIEDMQNTAHDKGGRCLSKSYINTHTKLQWECAEGHQWEAVPSSIKSGTWCPVCYKKRARNSYS